MKYLHSTSCGDPGQIGYGISTYRGIPYQEGYGLYQGQVFQRGHGLGGVLGRLFKATIRPASVALPALKRVGKAAKTVVLPALKKVGKAAAKRAGQHALSTGMDVVLRKKDLKEALKSSAKDLTKATVHDVIKEIQSIIPSILHQQSGRGKSASKKRKRKDSLGFTSSKKGRKTIFD